MPPARTVTGVEVERDGADRDLPRRHRGGLGRAPRTRRSCCWRRRTTATRTGSRNGSDQVGRNYMFHNSTAVLAISKEPNPTKFQKTLGINDFYFGSKDFEFPMGNIQMVGKSSAPMFRGEKPLQTKLAPTFTLDEVADARRRLLALDRGPAAGPRTGSRWRRTAASRSATRPTTRSPSSGCTTSSSRCSATSGMHPDHLIPRTTYLKNEIPIAGVAHQAGHRPVRRPTRRRRRSTPTARPTSWTTCTSSTRASSRASAR